MYSTVVSDVGTVRSNNQDSAFAGEHLIAICDGMGGHAGGDTASTIAIRSLAHIEQDLSLIHIWLRRLRAQAIRRPCARHAPYDDEPATCAG